MNSKKNIRIIIICNF